MHHLRAIAMSGKRPSEMMLELTLLFSLLLWIGVGVFYLRLPFASIWHPATLYFAIHGFLFVLRPIFGYFYPFSIIYNLYGFFPSVGDKVSALLAADLAFATFTLIVIRWARVLPSAAPDLSSLRRAIRWPAIIVCSALAPLALYVKLSGWTAVIDGTRTMGFDPRTGTTYNTDKIGWIQDSQYLLMPIAVIIGWTFRFKPAALIPLALFVTLQAGTGGRGTIIIGLVALALLYQLDINKRWPNMKAVLVGCFALTIFYGVGQDRGASIRALFVQDQKEVQSDNSKNSTVLDHMDYGNLEYLEYIIWVTPQRSGTYNYFVDNLQVLTEPIPRKLWKNKPFGPPIRYVDLFEYGFPVGMTMSLPGYGWLQLGYPGVLIWSALAGILYAWAYRKFAANGDSPFIVLSYCIMFAGSIVFFRDGVLVNVLRALPFYVGPVFLIWLLSRGYIGKTFGSRTPGQFQLVRNAGKARLSSKSTAHGSAARLVPRAWRD